MFNPDPTFRNSGVVSFFIGGQFVLFRSFDRNCTVLMQPRNSQITFIGYIRGLTLAIMKTAWETDLF